MLDNNDGIIQSTLFNTIATKDRLKYFTKAPNFPTLRIALCKRAILVEGPTDEMMVLYYFMKQYKVHPFVKGIELIVIGGNKMFPRFTEIADSINKHVAIITDNDGDVLATVKARVNPNNYSCVEVFSEMDNTLHTIEPSFVAANKGKLQELSDLLRSRKVKDDTQEDLSAFMEIHKTDWAYKLLCSDNYDFNVPKYIIDAVNWILN